MPRYPKKLIEVALPLDDINTAAIREKSIRHGHPSTLHLWWARRPLAVARAVLFAQLVNDPGGHRGWGSNRGQTKDQAKKDRERLFGIIRELVQWENTNNEDVLARARAEIQKSWVETCAITGEDPKHMPKLLDPFAGGGTIPLEAQRLGLEAHASDLNPVSVLLNTALIDIPSRFAGLAPVSLSGSHAEHDRTVARTWLGAAGLAEDVQHYGRWIRDEAWHRIGHLYPPVALSKKDHSATVMAWIWGRTVTCPNPACGLDMPLFRSFFLCNMKNREVWVTPKIIGRGKGASVEFSINEGTPTVAERAQAEVGCGFLNANGKPLKAAFKCLACGSLVKGEYIDSVANAVGLGQVLVAVVAEGERGRIYLPPEGHHHWLKAQVAPYQNDPRWLKSVPNQECRGTFASNAQGRRYGFKRFGDYFTTRQLVALTTFSDLIADAKSRIQADALAAGLPSDDRSLVSDGRGAVAYAESVAVYLTFLVSGLTDRVSSLCSWDSGGPTWGTKVRNAFSRQAITMSWDFAEVNPFSTQSGSINNDLDYLVKSIRPLGHSAPLAGTARQRNAEEAYPIRAPIISTDPPYYDNICYSDLSDYFYVWIRRSLGAYFPELLSTLLTPKADELIATPYRHESKEAAHKFFMDGMKSVLARMAEDGHPAHPLTIYYAFKQADTKDVGTASSGWEAFLQAVIDSGLMVTGTWPMRTELSNRMIGMGANALASSIVLACRPRSSDSPGITRRQFIKDLGDQLPVDLDDMINGSIGISPVAPVDLAQAAIGPGMALFSQYSSVIEADGTAMTVHQALLLINKAIDDYFDAAEGRMDGLTRFCTRWLTAHGFSAGPYGEADGLSRACGVDVTKHAESLESGKGKARLTLAVEHDAEILPDLNDQPSVWTSLHRIAGRLESADTSTAGAYLARVPQQAADIRALAYRVYTLCERAKMADAARIYNNVITSWDSIVHGSEKTGVVGRQKNLFESGDE